MNKIPVIGVIDLGASGGRIFFCRRDSGRLSMEEVHRFVHEPYSEIDENHTRENEPEEKSFWDLFHIWREIVAGLKKITSRGELELVSLGIDTWGCDGGWLDSEGNLMEMIPHNRDARWESSVKELRIQFSGQELYEKTGTTVQSFSPLNQIYWYAKNHPGIVAKAHRYLPFVSLLYHFFGGKPGIDSSWTSTSLLSSPGSCEYNRELMKELELPVEKMPPINPPGFILGKCNAKIASDLGCEPFKLILPCTHDTAGAFTAAHTGKNSVIISSGTWYMVGMNTPEPIISETAREAGFINIGGYRENIFLSGLTGSWPAQQLRRQWSKNEKKELSWKEFTELAKKSPAIASVLDIDNPVFFADSDMEDTIKTYCKETGQPVPSTRNELARIVYEGLALKVSHAVESLKAITGMKFDEIVIGGGGTYNKMVNQWVANLTGLHVHTGLPDATSAGNALVQAVTLGWIDDIETGIVELLEENMEETYAQRTPEKSMIEKLNKLRELMA